MLKYLAKNPSSTHHRLLGELFQALTAVLPCVTSLFSAESVAMGETIIIQAVYIAIGPFFVLDSSDVDGKGKKESVVVKTFGKTSMRGLRLEALALIRRVSFLLGSESGCFDQCW